ncbi:MAG TPA: ABC transporter ATP-binding protein, partial [Firmicutes bacterium]|nr:ABC transporter ATP-binding protein [Bacillota bacterium]
FVGPSGCGKSTTLRMIAGLEDISEGTISIDGKVVNTVEPMNRDIAMVFQNYALYPHMTVYNNMAFGLKQRKLLLPKIDKDGNQVKDANGEIIYVKRHYSKKEIDEKVKEASRILELDEYLQRKPKALSGGQRQRVAIGRSIVRSPKVFLMDEPLSNLDAKLRNQMRSEIIQLRKKIQTTFVYVTHDQIEAMTLGDRIVIMKDGIIQQVGTPLEVFNHPTNLFVACFIGTPQMNFIDAKYIDSQLTIGSKTIDLTKEFLANQDVESLGENNVCVGIRPRSVKVMDQEGYDEKYAFEGTVNVSEQLGDEVLLYLTVEGKDGDFTIAGNPKKQYKIGDKVKFSINPNEIHLFNPVTEKTLYISK